MKQDIDFYGDDLYVETHKFYEVCGEPRNRLDVHGILSIITCNNKNDLPNLEDEYIQSLLMLNKLADE